MNIGDRYARLVVISDLFKDGKYPKVRVKCDCGTERVVLVDNLKSGHTQSCGCLCRERTRQASTTHGQSRTHLYDIWSSMLQRCTDPEHKAYHNYGGRGITLCDEWRFFEAFQQWAKSAGYADYLTIDRRDNDGNYCPENCRWTTATVQCQNRRKMRSNTSGYIGVSESKRSGRHLAYAYKNDRQIPLGAFDTAIEAAKVRDNYVSEHYESPVLNFQE